MTKFTSAAALSLIAAGLSLSAFAGHHEKSESAAHSAKDKVEKMRKDLDEAEVKAKIDEAQSEIDMSKLHDEAEEEAAEAAPE